MGQAALASRRSSDDLLKIRQLTLSDVPWAMRLVEIAEWNQTPSDWDRLVRVSPDGCFAVEWDGRKAGTATAVDYGTDCGWVGMVLVDPDFRNRGIGGALIGHCIAHLKGLGIRTIKLDATDPGRAVYLKQGFVDEYAALRHVGQLRPANVPQVDCTIEQADLGTAIAAAGMDRTAFGADRLALLVVLAEQRPELALVALRGGKVIGYGLARPGRLHGYIGPVIAERMDVAQALVAALAGKLNQQTLLIDTTALNEPWCRWLEESGLRIQRRLTRMYLGANDMPGDPRLVYALSAFETG